MTKKRKAVDKDGFGVEDVKKATKVSREAAEQEAIMDQARVDRTLGKGYRPFTIVGDGSCWSSSIAVAAEFEDRFQKKFLEDDVRQLVCDTIRDSPTLAQFLSGEDRNVERLRDSYQWGEKSSSGIADLVLPAFAEATGCCVRVVGLGGELEAYGDVGSFGILLLRKPDHYNVIVSARVPEGEVRRKIAEVQEGKKELDGERARERLRSHSKPTHSPPPVAKRGAKAKRKIVTDPLPEVDFTTSTDGSTSPTPAPKMFATQIVSLEPQTDVNLKFISASARTFWNMIDRDILEKGTEFTVDVEAMMDRPTMEGIRNQCAKNLPTELTEETQWVMGMAVGQAHVDVYSRGVVGVARFPWSVLQAGVKLALTGATQSTDMARMSAITAILLLHQQQVESPHGAKELAEAMVHVPEMIDAIRKNQRVVEEWCKGLPREWLEEEPRMCTISVTAEEDRSGDGKNYFPLARTYENLFTESSAVTWRIIPGIGGWYPIHGSIAGFLQLEPDNSWTDIAYAIELEESGSGTIFKRNSFGGIVGINKRRDWETQRQRLGERVAENIGRGEIGWRKMDMLGLMQPISIPGSFLITDDTARALVFGRVIHSIDQKHVDDIWRVWKEGNKDKDVLEKLSEYAESRRWIGVEKIWC